MDFLSGRGAVLSRNRVYTVVNEHRRKCCDRHGWRKCGKYRSKFSANEVLVCRLLLQQNRHTVHPVHKRRILEGFGEDDGVLSPYKRWIIVPSRSDFIKAFGKVQGKCLRVRSANFKKNRIRFTGSGNGK